MTKTKIVPRGKYVLVKPENEAVQESEHGLLIPKDVEQEQKAMGIVIDIGSEIKDIKKGEKVVYGAYAGENIKILEGGTKIAYKLLHTDDIIAFITN